MPLTLAVKDRTGSAAVAGGAAKPALNVSGQSVSQTSAGGCVTRSQSPKLTRPAAAERSSELALAMRSLVQYICAPPILVF